jgi:hypothetical protein
MSRHGAPIAFAVLLWWVLWWGHSPVLDTVEAAMWHVSWVGTIALLYVSLQARAVLVQPRHGVLHSMIELLVSLFPLFVVAFAAFEWMRGGITLSVFQVIAMVQATIATLIDVVIFTWFSMSLSRLALPIATVH